ncbi:MAG: hypothetical protein ACTHMX_13110, partial [Thermomicrobiales bacterium]
MSTVVGVRRMGESRITFVRFELEGTELRPGQQVTIEVDDATHRATVAIGTGQLIETSEPPAIEGVVASVESESPRQLPGTSDADTAYRARKARFPALGSRIGADGASGTVIRIDLRSESLDLATETGDVLSVRLADV